jgi:hypothetical protein
MTPCSINPAMLDGALGVSQAIVGGMRESVSADGLWLRYDVMIGGEQVGRGFGPPETHAPRDALRRRAWAMLSATAVSRP